jgi:hypothetical protein
LWGLLPCLEPDLSVPLWAVWCGIVVGLIDVINVY